MHALQIVAPVVLLLGTAAAHADQAARERIRVATSKSGSTGVTMQSTAYNFAKATPQIYGFGQRTCDETIDGEATVVFREQFRETSGSTDTTI